MVYSLGVSLCTQLQTRPQVERHLVLVTNTAEARQPILVMWRAHVEIPYLREEEESLSQQLLSTRTHRNEQLVLSYIHQPNFGAVCLA